jgi:DNA polymerase delta subunit 2
MVAAAVAPAIRRAYSEAIPRWQRFQPAAAESPYGRQYSHVYSERLTVLRPMVWNRVRGSPSNGAGHGNGKIVERIIDLEEDELSTVVGTLVVRGRPDTEDNDSFLEDESGRVAVHLGTAASLGHAYRYVTGSVLGLTGTVADGLFQVERITTPAKVSKVVEEEQEQTQAQAKHDAATTTATTSSLALFLSGTECGSPQASSFPRDMLISYLQGALAPGPQPGHGGVSTAARVAHVYVAGNLIARQDDVVDGCRDLDAWCWELAQCTAVPVTLLPGTTDPTTANWPQRPLHPALIPNAAPSVQRATNPIATALGHRSIIATDGANADSVDALIRSLECAHICPQGPSEVPTVPNLDPMVMKEPPEIYVAGNCPSFATQLVHINDAVRCRILCLPKFIATGEAVLVDLATLDVELLRFTVDDDDEDKE